MASLLALSRAEFEEAKSKFRHRNWANLGTLGAGLATILLSSPLAYLFAVLALMAQGIAWWSRYEGGRLQSIAEEARRRSALIGALGSDSEPLDTADLRQRLSKKAKAKVDKFEDPDYYVSTHPPGPDRLRDYLQESAFRSKHLYAAAARRSFKWFTFLLIAVLAVALVALPFTSGSAQLFAARALVVFLSSFPVSNELEQALAWQTAADQADAVDRRLEGMYTSSVEPVLAVFSDYSVATANAPPIPTAVYESEKDHLNQLWAERRQALQDE